MARKWEYAKGANAPIAPSLKAPEDEQPPEQPIPPAAEEAPPQEFPPVENHAPVERVGETKQHVNPPKEAVNPKKQPETAAPPPLTKPDAEQVSTPPLAPARAACATPQAAPEVVRKSYGAPPRYRPILRL